MEYSAPGADFPDLDLDLLLQLPNDLKRLLTIV